MWPHFWAPCIFWVPTLNWVMAMTHLALPPVLGCLQAEMLLNLLWDTHLAWSPAGLGQSPGCQSLPWHRALPASPPAWAFWVLGEDWNRPFPSGLKMRSGHWSRSGPHIYYQSVLGRFLNIGGRRGGIQRNPCLEQQRRNGWNRSTEPWLQKLLNGGLGGGGGEIKEAILYPCPGTLKPRLWCPPCPQTCQLLTQAACTVPRMWAPLPNSSSCCWEAALDSQEPLISSEMEKQFQATVSGSVVSISDKVLCVISFPSLNITDVRLAPLRTTSGLWITWHEYVWNHGWSF